MAHPRLRLQKKGGSSKGSQVQFVVRVTCPDGLVQALQTMLFGLCENGCVCLPPHLPVRLLVELKRVCTPAGT